MLRIREEKANNGNPPENEIWVVNIDGGI